MHLIEKERVDRGVDKRQIVRGKRIKTVVAVVEIQMEKEIASNEKR